MNAVNEGDLHRPAQLFAAARATPQVPLGTELAFPYDPWAVMGVLLRIGLVVCVLGVLYGGIAAPDGKAVTGCSSTTALSFGAAPTAASIGAAGEKDCFTFTGAAGDRVRIRIAETSGTLGTVQVLFNPSSVSTCGGASKATELNCPVNVAGTWTITVQDAAGNRTGNYRIAIQRLNNPLNCTSISSGAAPLTGSIASAAEMDCYTFATTSSTQVFRVRVAETGASPTLVARDDIVRPNGSTICAATTNLDLTCALDATGTHTIYVSDNAGTETGNYAIATRRLDSNAGCTSLTLGAAPVTGTIAAAAELDCFRFTGAVGDVVAFRATKISGSLDARSVVLVRPDGTFSSCEPCQLDVAGTYTIIVGDLAGTGTGDYRISIQRLNNPVGCTSLSFGGSPSAGTSEPGELDCYTFNGSDLDQVQVHLVAADSFSFARFDLFGPAGAFRCSATTNFSLSADSLCSLDQTGLHTIVVEGSNASTGYSLSIERMNNPVGCSAISFGGGPSTGSIADAEMDCYTFGANAGDQVRIRRDEVAGSLDVTAELFSADGRLVPGCFDQRERACSIDSTGSYTILVRDDPFLGLETGDYALAIQRLNNPVGCTPLSFGAPPFVGSINVAEEIDCYTFSGAAGDQIQIALPVTAGTNARAADVFDPSGQLVCSVSFVTPPCALADTGTYSILVESVSNGFVATFDYAVALQRLNNPPGPSCSGLVFGAAPTAASIGAAGELDCYTFAGAVGDQIRIRLTATSGTLQASSEVAQTDGTLVCPHVAALEVTCSIDAAGQHRIIVSDNSFDKKTGSYAIAVQRLNAPNNCSALTFGAAPTTATIGGASEMDCYTLSGTAGDRIRVHVTSSGALVKHGEIVRPNGTTQCSGLGTTSSDLTCRLDTTGNARLLIDDTTGKLTGGYTVAVQRLNNSVGCVPLVFGAAPSAGSIAAAGEVDCFTFTGAAGDRVQERPVATSGTLVVAGELVRPNGTTVSTSACMPCSLDSPGIYTILVDDSSGTGTGNYALALQRLNNPVGCTPIAFGAAPATGTLAAGEMDCFTYAGATGDRIHAELAQTSGAPTLTGQLFSPSGSQVCVFNQGFPPVYACGLNATGTHTILVSGLTGSGSGAGNYSLSVQRDNNPTGCGALGFGGPPTTGTIAVAAENDCFTFAGNAGDRIRVRPTETSGTLSFQTDVLRPSGTIACENTDSFGSSPEFTCALTVSGTHTLVLADSAGTHTGNYAIEIQRLNAPVGCTPLPAPGTPAAGSIAVAEFDCFTVAATNGTTIPLDLAQTSGTIVPRMEVVRTNGTTKCPPTTAAHLDCTPDTTGTYTVLVGDSFPFTRTGGYTLTRTS